MFDDDSVMTPIVGVKMTPLTGGAKDNRQAILPCVVTLSMRDAFIY